MKFRDRLRARKPDVAVFSLLISRRTRKPILDESLGLSQQLTGLRLPNSRVPSNWRKLAPIFLEPTPI
jgi:hypothetical protein